MTEKTIRTEALGLDKTVARCAVIVREKHPRTGESHTVVGLVNRPYWSKQGANEWSLVGGKINDSDIEDAGIDGAQRSVDLGESEAVARRAAQREVMEEIGVDVTLDELMYVGLFYNGAWASALFYVLLDERPAIILSQKDSPMDEIDGFVWMGTNRVAVGGKLFVDHETMVIDAVNEALGANVGSK